MRGRDQPWVAAPRTWDELDDPGLSQLRFDEVLARVEAGGGDLLAELDPPLPFRIGRTRWPSTAVNVTRRAPPRTGAGHGGGRGDPATGS